LDDTVALGSLPLLSQRIAGGPELACLRRPQAEVARTLGQRPTSVIWVVIPLPLQAQGRGSEIVGGRELRDRLTEDWLRGSRRHVVAVSGRAEDRPIVFPENRTDPRHAPDRPAILHGKAEPLVVEQRSGSGVRKIDDRALMTARGLGERHLS